MRGRNLKNPPFSGFPNPKKRKGKEGEREKEERERGVRNKMLKADTLYICEKTEKKTNRRGIKKQTQTTKRSAKRMRSGLVGAA